MNKQSKSLGEMVREHAKAKKGKTAVIEIEPNANDSEEAKESNVGLEAQMELFIRAVHAKDAEKATEIFIDMMELC